MLQPSISSSSYSQSNNNNNDPICFADALSCAQQQQANQLSCSSSTPDMNKMSKYSTTGGMEAKGYS